MNQPNKSTMTTMTDVTKLLKLSRLNLASLSAYENWRSTNAKQYKQDIELSLRNLKDEYHKIILCCEDQLRKAGLPIPPEISTELQHFHGTPPNEDEIRMAKQNIYSDTART